MKILDWYFIVYRSALVGVYDSVTTTYFSSKINVPKDVNYDIKSN